MFIGTELLFVILLGFLVVGPRQMNAMLGHVARAKAEFDRATRSFKSQLAAEPEANPLPPQDSPRL
jgi:Sec-independent protein translocase protein TatA